jgi:hypothetical protein
MTQPSEDEQRRMVAFWRSAYHPSSELGEKANAFAALKRMQADLKLSDVELAFICESTITADAAPRGEPPDLLCQILGLFEGLHIILATLAREIAVALWAAHTHVFERFLHTPRLLAQSSEPECGKTTLFMCLEQLVHNGEYSDDFTPATIYHQLNEQPDTCLLLDEIDNSSLWDSDPLLRKVFNAGHRRGGNVRRLIKGEIVRLPCFAPLALASISKYRFPAPLWSRSIVIDMEKRAEGLDEIWPGDNRCALVRAGMSEFAANFQIPLNVKIPFSGRARNNWEPLIAVATTLGYPETGRAVALEIHRSAMADDPVTRVFRDIHQVFEGRKIDRVWTDPELLSALRKEFGWDEFWGLSGDEDPHKLTRGELYRLLKTKGIRSQSVFKEVAGRRVSKKGFLREQFEPVWCQLFPGTPAQPSNIIRLTRHKKRHSAGTGGSDVDDDIGRDIGDDALNEGEGS